MVSPLVINPPSKPQRHHERQPEQVADGEAGAHGLLEETAKTAAGNADQPHAAKEEQYQRCRFGTGNEDATRGEYICGEGCILDSAGRRRVENVVSVID